MKPTRSRRQVLVMLVLAAELAMPAALARAGGADRRLDVSWIDVEGGAATLIVTPAGESVLIDAGNPGPRDAGRIVKATQTAGLTRIDHLIVTHFHSDHFGGVADLAALIPIGTLYDNGIASAPDEEKKSPLLEGYAKAKVAARKILKPGLRIPLARGKGGAALSLRVVGTRQDFGKPRGRDNRALCAGATVIEADASDNKNSVVLLLELGKFRLFDGGDLTWNTEAALVCPKDRVGAVDVLQINHHGLDTSNNPVLLGTLAPRVTVFNNGTKKGCGPKTFQTVKGLPSTEAIYQVHRNLRDDKENNSADDLIANEVAECEGHAVTLSVAPDGKSYTMAVPSKQHRREFKSGRRE